jgi:hypothetical protein
MQRIELWGLFPVSPAQLQGWEHFPAAQRAYFEAQEERRGLSIRASGTLNGLWVPHRRRPWAVLAFSASIDCHP